MKFLVLCNSRLGFQAIEYLASAGMLAACATPETLNEETEELHFFCKQQGITIRTFTKQNLLKDMKEWVTFYKPDAVLVLTFSYLIPEELLTLPPKGFINFHFGLLPAYRGANAIFWEIKNREKYGAISAHQMTRELDKGSIILMQKIDLAEDDTYGSHMNKLAQVAPSVVGRVIGLLQSNETGVVQNELEAKYYPKPKLADVLIDWTKSPDEIISLINACNPWNKGAITLLNGTPVKIIHGVKTETTNKIGHSPGIIIKITKEGLWVACGNDQQLLVSTIFVNNEFLNGYYMPRAGFVPGLIFNH